MDANEFELEMNAARKLIRASSTFCRIEAVIDYIAELCGTDYSEQLEREFVEKRETLFNKAIRDAYPNE